MTDQPPPEGPYRGAFTTAFDVMAPGLICIVRTMTPSIAATRLIRGCARKPTALKASFHASLDSLEYVCNLV
jgi:hypothetical protein